jgi:hypothetical protein
MKHDNRENRVGQRRGWNKSRMDEDEDEDEECGRV